MLVYAPDRPDLFARICGYFDSAGFNILDAKVHTTTTGYALDTFQVISPTSSRHYRDLIAYVETQLALALEATGPLPEPSRGRISRRVRSFPVTPRVTLRPDERAQRWLLAVSASDRSGLLYAISRVLARHDINLQLAKITTLGERVEDTFLIDGPALQQNKMQLQTAIRRGTPATRCRLRSGRDAWARSSRGRSAGSGSGSHSALRQRGDLGGNPAF